MRSLLIPASDLVLNSGRMIGLSQVSALTSHIALHAVSAAKTEQIINQNENEIVQNAFILNQNIDQVIDNLYAKLKEQNTHIDTGFADNIYLTSPEGSENQKLWNNATDLAGAKDKIKPVSSFFFCIPPKSFSGHWPADQSKISSRRCHSEH